ncbi:MAG: sensor histidine kinase [Muribaculaceae bacterium]|nr:sensor histidine kinase [Muribaculaceae bacterium]
MTATIQETKNNNRYLVLHLLCWAVIIVVPMFFHSSGDDWPTVMNRYLRWLGNPLAYMLVFYVNYLWLVPRFLLKKRDWKMFLFINILMIVAGLITIDLFHWCVTRVLPEIPSNRQYVRLPLYFWAILTLILIIALAVAVRITQRWQHIEEARKEAEAARAEAELSNLRNQLNPHFLLNTLNNIYALIAFDQDKAQTAVGELSKLLRHVLYESQEDFVPLSKEVDFINNYIELMKIRMTDNVKVHNNIHVKPNDSTPVAPLLFISLIENAFKHGISPQGKGEISIDLHQVNGDITCEILNTCYPKRENDKSGSGIGLEQVSRRLELLYPERYTWEKGKSEDGQTYYSKLTIKKES